MQKAGCLHGSCGSFHQTHLARPAKHGLRCCARLSMRWRVPARREYPCRLNALHGAKMGASREILKMLRQQCTGVADRFVVRVQVPLCSGQ